MLMKMKQKKITLDKKLITTYILNIWKVKSNFPKECNHSKSLQDKVATCLHKQADSQLHVQGVPRTIAL